MKTKNATPVTPVSFSSGRPIRRRPAVSFSVLRRQSWNYLELAHEYEHALSKAWTPEMTRSLAASFERFQTAFEGDARYEYWPLDAGQAFRSAEPELGPALDAWVAKAPASFAPYLARGWHRLAVTMAKRGRKWAKDTAQADFSAMREAARRFLMMSRRTAATSSQTPVATSTTDWCSSAWISISSSGLAASAICAM